jgi:KDO2-lipid IV(A) lauroyltransferase
MSVSRWLLEIQYLAEYLLVWPIVTVVRRLSEKSSRRLARSISRVAYRTFSFDRHWCLKNLELIFGDQLTSSERTALTMQVFENITLTVLEAVRWTPEWMANHVVEEGGVEARRVIQEAARQGKGFIIISAHLGNFEIINACSHCTGEKCTVLYRPQNNWRVERLLAGARAKYMPRIVPRGPYGMLKLRETLRRAEGVGLAIDMNTTERGVFVDFLGFPAASPPGAAVLALATGAPVILAVSLRQPDGSHRIVFHPPFPLIQTGNRAHDILANTQQYTKALEEYVLTHPEQYNWPHPRWRFRPDGSVWQWQTPIEKLAAERISPRRPSRFAAVRGQPGGVSPGTARFSEPSRNGELVQAPTDRSSNLLHIDG